MGAPAPGDAGGAAVIRTPGIARCMSQDSGASAAASKASRPLSYAGGYAKAAVLALTAW